MARANLQTALIAICALGISAMAAIQVYQFTDYLAAKGRLESAASRADTLAEHCRLMRQLGLNSDGC